MPVAVDAVTLKLAGVVFKQIDCVPKEMALITGKSFTTIAAVFDASILQPAAPPPLLIFT